MISFCFVILEIKLRENFGVACDAEECETEKDRRTSGASRPGLYRRIIAKDARTEGVRDFVFDKIILASGNEVTRALITRRLIANYEHMACFRYF